MNRVVLKKFRELYEVVKLVYSNIGKEPQDRRLDLDRVNKWVGILENQLEKLKSDFNSDESDTKEIDDVAAFGREIGKNSISKKN